MPTLANILLHYFHGLANTHSQKSHEAGSIINSCVPSPTVIQPAVVKLVIELAV